MIWYELTRAFAYRRIKHPAMSWYTWRLPVLLGLFALVVFVIVPVPPRLFASDGLVSSLITFLSILPGFYIAALAAVATFNRQEMDEEMPDPTPTVVVEMHGQSDEVPLTRRTFLSLLFAYLSVLTLLMALVCIAAKALAPSIDFWVTRSTPTDWLVFVRTALKVLFVGPVFLCLASILITTLHGVYFLADRMHRPN